MKSKNIVPIIVFILVIGIASAISLRPDIDIEFDVVVDNNTVDVNLTDASGTSLDLVRVDSDNPAFKYRPTSNLAEGFYTVTAQAEDIDGVLGPIISLNFFFQIPPVIITLIQPSFGVSPTDSFNFTIETDKLANCRYNKAVFDTYEGLDFIFDNVTGNIHTTQNFNFAGEVYVGCNSSEGEIAYEEFTLSVDRDAPIVMLTADDVTQPTSLNKFSTTLISTVDKESVCKYSKEDEDYEDMDYEFPDYDEEEESAYKTRHEQELTQDILIDKEVNTIYGICRGKSGRLSDIAHVDINVDTDTPPEIYVHSPERYISDLTPFFDVTTNRDATCNLYTGSPVSSSNHVGLMGVGMVHQIQILNPLDVGTYTYYVECTFNINAPQPSPVAVTFTIDDTPPNMTYVDIDDYNGTGKVYDDEELCAEWEGVDGESTISLYAYYIYWDKSTDELIEEGTTSPQGDNEYCVDDLELNDSESYYFEVSAQNAVGLWSENMISSSVEVDFGLLPESCTNNQQDGDESDLNCGGGICGGCDEGENCFVDSDCDSNYCNSSDKCEKPECNDGVENGRESDVDCGGNCNNKCEVGDDCNDDDDCETDNCKASTGECDDVLDRCENHRLDDPPESDIDCGGSCPGCPSGKACYTDDDCVPTAKCEDSVCSSDSDGDGIIDNEDNCPGEANGDQADVDDDNIGDICDNDNDNDGLPDSFEKQYFDCATCVGPDDDPDNDGLTNLDEYNYNTNPTKEDTDDDGYGDKEEIDKGYDPLDPSSHPGGGFWKYFLSLLGLGILGAGGYYGYMMLKQKKKPFVPPRPGMRAVRPGMRRPIRRPMMRRPPIRPRYGTPRMRVPIKRGLKISKPAIVKRLEKKKEDIFDRLSSISKSERVGQVEKHMESLKLTDKELKGRIEKLKKELKVK